MTLPSRRTRLERRPQIEVGVEAEVEVADGEVALGDEVVGEEEASKNSCGENNLLVIRFRSLLGPLKFTSVLMAQYIN